MRDHRAYERTSRLGRMSQNQKEPKENFYLAQLFDEMFSIDFYGL